MKHRIGRFFTAIYRFVYIHRLLSLLSFVFLIGCVLGIAVFYRTETAEGVHRQLLPLSVQASFGELIRAIGASCFSGWLMLLILYLTGLSPCGVFAAVAVPLFYGLGIGMLEAALCRQGWIGLASMVLFIVPRGILCAAALLLGGCETLRMSVLIGRQLFPSGSRHGEIARRFRLYSLRFFLLGVLVLGSGIVDAVLRMLWYPLS